MDPMTSAPVALISRSETERAGTPLLVLLHGYGSNEQDLMGLLRLLPEEFTYLSVRAPLPAGPGYSWFPLNQDIDYSLDAVEASVQALWQFLAPQLQQHSSLSLLGFSQGMAMATSLARYRREAVTAVVGLSGFVVQAPDSQVFDDAKLKADPLPLFWGRDVADPVITPQKVEYTMGWVQQHAKLTHHTYPQIQHSVCAEELADVSAFLRAHVLQQAK
ncbi:Phospholipase [Glutamicibacter creatinolyticus]|uniref:Phospholipase n=2 Tax=Micrococcaceae TaxID=1268 RepID=A0A5B7WRC8_9MICC|nr:Phospholipase [Glutamicibacter creatinolyticus]